MELKDIVSNMQFPMIDLTKAFSIMRKVINFNINEREYDIVNVNDAYGRILCQSIYSDCNVPACRVSTKHGFAVLASDGSGIRIVSDEITVSCNIKMLIYQQGVRVIRQKTFCRILQYLSILGHAHG